MQKYFIPQLSVFIENQKGELSVVTGILKENGISIKSIILNDSKDFGILRLIVDDPQKAKESLSHEGISSKLSTVFGVRIEDKIGSFDAVVKALNAASIDIRYTYIFHEGSEGVFIFKVDDAEIEKALLILSENNLELVNTESI